MKNNRLYVDIHILQTVPPSCVNRDDTGSPKTAMYGGAMRSRVSSQSWKRAVRTMFRDLLPNEALGVRTKKIVSMVANELRSLGREVDPEEAAKRILENAGLKIKSIEKGTDALFFLSFAQARALAKLAFECPDVISEKASKESKEKAHYALKQFPGIDVALFGRMVADDPSLNNDACAQVAHSISTHKINNEYDYFTAVDDMSDEDNAGAGHIGTVEFNSSTLYRYATVAVHELNRQLADETINAVLCFVKAFVSSMPTGKQNTFANRTLPDALLITLRKDQPINFVGAFEKPISASDEGYAAASAKRLSAHVMSVYKSFAKEPVLSLVTGELLSGLGNVQPLDDLINALKDALCEQMSNSGGLQ